MSQTEFSSPPQRKRWLIVGGGIMGMTLAQRLAERGQEVAIAEAAPNFGGLASAWQVGQVTWDRFYHVTMLSDSKLRGLLRELDLEREIRWVTTRTGFYSDGKLVSLSSSWEFLKFPPLNLVEKFRLGLTIFCGSKIKNWKRLEKIPIAQWLLKWSGRGTFEKIWLPLLRAKLGDAYEKTSAAFIWANISRMYRARRSGMKTEMFGYVPGGYARVLGAYTFKLRSMGVELLASSPVNQIASDQRAGLSVTLGDGRQLAFDNVISTLPSPAISASCPDLSEEEHRQLRSISYIGVVCASLVLSKPLSRFYVTNITDSSVPMTAVIEMSAIVDTGQFGGRSLVYLPKYYPSEHPGLDEPDESITARFLEALERMHPSFTRASVEAVRIARARFVMALPTLGYSDQLPPIVSSLAGFYALNSAHITVGTLNVNETIDLADKKFESIVWPNFLARSR